MIFHCKVIYSEGSANEFNDPSQRVTNKNRTNERTMKQFVYYNISTDIKI